MMADKATWTTWINRREIDFLLWPRWGLDFLSSFLVIMLIRTSDDNGLLDKLEPTRKSWALG